MSIIPSGDQSPFDAIREIDEYGIEIWRARRLQPLMAYPRWQHFEPVVKRAIAAASNVHDAEAVFTVDRKNPDGGGRPLQDYILSRAAAYYVAMNGDPVKPEVAAAQAYFVRQTRKAERAEAENARTPQPATTISWDQAAAIGRLQYGFDIDTYGLRDLLSKGGILTKELRPHRKWEHLFWPLANRWEIHAYVLPQLIRYAVTVRRQLAAAEEDLQLSLPLPMSGLLADEMAPVRRPAVLADVLNLPRQMRGDAS